MSDPSPMPSQLKMARVILYVQAVGNVLAVVLVAGTVASRVEHGQRVDPITYLLIAISVLLAVALLTSAIRLRRRPQWLRPTVIIMEVIVILAQFVAVLTGTFAAAIGLALAVVVIVTLCQRDAAAWLDHRDTAPS
ncbi:hypothetical protein [Amycolatopsis sp. NPDC059021]|uniref:hypothetical protein n=1 Tax=Amycolatopsis sp. NPDC059021 TaxID=3346704 RepID=UPI00366BB77F